MRSGNFEATFVKLQHRNTSCAPFFTNFFMSRVAGLRHKKVGEKHEGTAASKSWWQSRANSVLRSTAVSLGAHLSAFKRWGQWGVTAEGRVEPRSQGNPTRRCRKISNPPNSPCTPLNPSESAWLSLTPLQSQTCFGLRKISYSNELRDLRDLQGKY